MAYNPAGTATLEGTELNTSFASPYYQLRDARYSFFGIGDKLNKYFSMGISRNQITRIDTIFFHTGNTEEYNLKASLYTLNLSSQPIKNLLIGANINYLDWPIYENLARAAYGDFGVIKVFKFAQKGSIKHRLNIGTSISNLNFAELEMDLNISSSTELPAILRSGVNYQFTWDKKMISDTLSIAKILMQGDYRKLLKLRLSQWNSHWNRIAVAGTSCVSLWVFQ